MNVMWTPGLSLEMLEKMAILQALKYFRDNKTAAASALGIAVRTLDNKLAVYDDEENRRKAAQNEYLRQQREFYERAKGIVPTIIDGKRTPQAVASASADAGVCVEPAAQVSAEPSVPLPEQEKVQEVLHGETTESSKKRGRPSPYRTNENSGPGF